VFKVLGMLQVMVGMGVDATLGNPWMQECWDVTAGSRQDPGGQGYIIGPLVLGFTTRYVNIPTRDGSCRMFRIYRTYGIYGMPRNVCTDARMSSLTVKTPPRASPARCGPTLRPSPYYTCVDAP